MKTLKGYDVPIMLIDQADREIERRQLAREAAEARAAEALIVPKVWGSVALISDDELRVLHERHMEGVPCRVLGREVWQRFGYSSPGSAGKGIIRGFHRLGLYVHKPVAPRCTRVCEGIACDLPAGHPGFHHWRGMA